MSIPTEESAALYSKRYGDAYTSDPYKMNYIYKWPYNSDKALGAGDVISIANHSSYGRVLDFFIGIVVGGVIAVVIMNLVQKTRGHIYTSIQ